MTKQQKKEDLMKINPSKMDIKNDWTDRYGKSASG